MGVSQKHNLPKEKTVMGHAGDAAKSAAKAAVGAAKSVGGAVYHGLKSGEKAWKDLDLRDKKNDELRANIQGKNGRVM